MDDAQIKIGLSISTAGLDAAASQANESANAIKAAYDRVAAAAMEVKTAHQQQLQILAQYKKGTVDQATAETALSVNMERSAEAANLLANARRGLKAAVDQETVSVIENTRAQDANTASMVRGIAPRQAATAVFGIAEGRALSASRAAAAFVANTLKMGPVLEAAFPVIGAIALGSVIAAVGKEMYTAFDLGGERARKTDEDIRHMTDSLRLQNIEIEVQTERLKIQQERFEKKPTNNAKLAILETEEAVQRLQTRLDQATKSLMEFLKVDIEPTTEQKIFSGMAGTHQEQVIASEHARHLAEQTTEQGKLNESKSYAISLQTRLNELYGKQAVQESLANAPGGAGMLYRATAYINYDKEIEGTRRLIEAQKEEQRGIQDTMSFEKQEADTKAASDKADAARLAKQAQTEYDRRQMAHIEETLNQIRTRNRVGEQAEVDYWTFILNTAKLSAENYQRILEKLGAAKQAVFRAQERGADTSTADAAAEARQERILELKREIASAGKTEPLDRMHGELAGQERQHTVAIDRLKLEAKAKDDNLKGMTSYETPMQQKRDVEEQMAIHRKMAAEDQSYYEDRKDIVASGYRDQILQLDKVFEAQKKIRDAGTEKELAAIQPLKKKGEAGDPAAAKRYAEEERKIKQDAEIKELESRQKLNQDVIHLEQQKNQQIQSLEQQRVQAAQRARQQELQDATAIQNLIVQRYKAATSEMNSAIIGGLNEWMTTTKSFGNAMVDAAKKMAVSFIDAIAEMELKQLELYILQKLLGQSNQQDQTASTISQNVMVAESNAAVGATKVFAETGNIAAAVVALAEGEALATMAAFEKGGIIPGRRDQGFAILAHGEEAMLPAPLTGMLMKVATSGGTGTVGGAAHHFTSVYSPQISVLDSKGLEGFVRRAGDHQGREMRNYARRINLTN